MTSLAFMLSCLFGCSLGGGSSEFPNPQREWRMCGRTKPSYVCDPDFILERGDADRLDQIAQEFRKSTSCMCPKCTDDTGVSVGVFLKQNVSKESLSKYPTGKDISEMLRRRWSLSTCDSDIVIVLVTQMNMTSYSMGPIVQTIFPADTADQILGDCLGHFSSGWHYQGLESVLNSFNDVLVGAQRQGPRIFRNLVLGIGLGFGVMLVLAVVALLLLHRQQVKRRKSNCSDIFQNSPRNNNRHCPSFDQEQHLEKLRHLNGSDEDDNKEEDATTYEEYAERHPSDVRSSVKFMRMYRQLSDVTEESGEDDLWKRNSAQTSFNSSCYSPKGSVPVTEL